MRDFSEPSWEPEDIFDRKEAENRRAQLDLAIERNAAFMAQEEAQAAKRKEEMRQWTMAGNARDIRRQYDIAGVAPPQVDNNGVPTVSLSLLLWIGWTIEEQPDFGGGTVRVLSPPFVPRQHERKIRDQYDQNS